MKKNENNDHLSDETKKFVLLFLGFFRYLPLASNSTSIQMLIKYYKNPIKYFMKTVIKIKIYLKEKK